MLTDPAFLDLHTSLTADLRVGIDAFVAEVLRRFEIARTRFTASDSDSDSDFSELANLLAVDTEFLAHQVMFPSTAKTSKPKLKRT